MDFSNKTLVRLLPVAILVFASTPLSMTAETKKKASLPRKEFFKVANMDKSVKPGDNFYEYANGNWVKNTKIPANQVGWGSFYELAENNDNHLHEILEAAAKSAAKAGSVEGNVGNFYKSGMDSANIDEMGIKPVQYLLDRVDKIHDITSFWDEVCQQQTEGISQLFGFGIGPDDKNVTEEICNFAQGGIGLPTKEYYTATDARSTQIREAYKKYIGQILEFAGIKDPKAGEEIFSFEKYLAEASLTPVEMRDPQKMYNKFSAQQLKESYPNLNFTQILNGLKVPAFAQESVLISTTQFYKALNDLDKNVSVATLRNYLKFHLLSAMAPYLSSDIDKVHFSYYGTVLTGLQAQKPRWKRVMGIIDGSIGDQLGQMYVEKHFKPEAKTYMLALVNNLQSTFAERIHNLDWMSASTKAKAIEKLDAFTKKIGYPDKWKDYSKLTIVADNYAANIINTSAFEYDFQINKLGKPVDRTEWGMTPPTVNAYYNPAFNEIVFPAGILQFPFFDFNADDAINYGGIGAVIGHEMTHGFDDQGRQYDAKGNLSDWWSAEDATKFEKRAQEVIEQFNKYTVLDSIHVNGQLTIGENLADLGGITIAYQAFKKTQQGQSQQLIDGFTPDQRFFLSWAQVWRSIYRPQIVFQLIKTDPHAPALWRVNGPLSNFTPFYKAFNVKPGEKMYKPEDQRTVVW